MGAPNHYGGAESLRGVLKSPNNVASTFFNTVNLLPKDHRFEHRGAKLASCLGRHLTSLRPWLQCMHNSPFVSLREENRKRHFTLIKFALPFMRVALGIYYHK